MSRLQIQFQHFPGLEPWSTMGDWRFLPGPSEDVPADPEDAEVIPDAIMRLVDYAIQYAPEVFAVDLIGGDYELVNDLSIELVGRVLSAVDHAQRDGEAKPPPTDAVTARWYIDVDLANGVTIRVAEFK